MVRHSLEHISSVIEPSLWDSALDLSCLDVIVHSVAAARKLGFLFISLLNSQI